MAMVTCSCGKTIEKMPEWLASVKVEFVCNNCPQRTHRAQPPVSALGGDSAEKSKAKTEVPDDLDLEDEEDED